MIIPQLVNIYVLRNSVNFTKKFVMDFCIEINFKILLLNEIVKLVAKTLVWYNLYKNNKYIFIAHL